MLHQAHFDTKGGKLSFAAASMNDRVQAGFNGLGSDYLFGEGKHCFNTEINIHMYCSQPRKAVPNDNSRRGKLS
jgi:hypothetical protein